MDHRSKPLALALVLFVWLFSGCQTETPTVPSQTQSARLSEVVGSVQIKNPDQAEFVAAAENAVLLEGGEVRTGDDSRARLDLSTGTIIRLAPNTSFLLTANTETETGLFTRLRLAAGRLWVMLTGGSLEVETPAGTAAVRGSHLMVWIDPLTLNVWVSCFEGECAAANDSGSLNLSTGEGALLYLAGPGETPPPPTAYLLTWEEFQAWTSNVPEANALLPDTLATLTAFPTPTPTASVTPTPTALLSPNAVCTLQLLSPANGATLPASGELVFHWSPQPGAEEYRLQIISINGAVNTFSTTNTSLTRYLESLSAAGTYSWQVSALDEHGQVICTAGSFMFTKPATVIETLLPPQTPLLTHDTNTYFTFIEGPLDPVTEFCDQRYFKVIVADSDGVSSVWVGYQVQDSMGTPICSGTLPLSFNNGLWSGNPIIPANPSDQVYWWFAAADNLGNPAASEVYFYQEISVCP